MKSYEGLEAGRRFMKLLPIVCRIDGRNFSKFTRNLNRPFDERFQKCMIGTTKWLVEETGAQMGYTQSDEISLVWYSSNAEEQVFFDGRIQKMTSVLAAMATAKFSSLLVEELPEKVKSLPVFDCRVWVVPSLSEAANVFIWRELDAIKNSIAMLAQSVFSHNQLHGKHGGEMLEMLTKKGVEWDACLLHSRRGTYWQRTRREISFSPEEIDKLPINHEARKTPDLKILRGLIRELGEEMFSLRFVENREGVVFRGEDPILKEID